MSSYSGTSTYYVIFGLLLLLLAATVGVAEIDLGLFNFPAAATIATTKAVLILLYFMHLRQSPPLIWLVAGGSLFFLAIMFTITFSDYMSRAWLGG